MDRKKNYPHWIVDELKIRMYREEEDDLQGDLLAIACQRAEAAERFSEVGEIFPHLPLWRDLRQCFGVTRLPRDSDKLEAHAM